MDTDIKWDNLQYELTQFAETLMRLIRANLAQDGSNASYTLSDTIGYKIGIEDGKYWVDIEMEDYWKYVNDGRRPGRMPPIDKIAEWIRVKPIQPKPYTYTPSVKSLAFLIQRSIKREKGYAPPRIVLEGWIQKKHITPQERTITPSVESLAFLIARKIGKYGTKGTHFFDDAVQAAKDAYEVRIDRAIQDDIALWLETVVDDVLDSMVI